MTASPARPATLPPELPEWDPQWSRLVGAACADGVRTFHVLDTLPALRAQGIEPTGTILALHGNPTWSYLWRRLAAATVAAAPAAAAAGERVWRVIAPDQLEMGFSERLAHPALPAPRTGDWRRIADRVADFDAVVTQLLAEVPGSDAGRDTAGSGAAGSGAAGLDSAGEVSAAETSADPRAAEAPAGPAHPVVTLGHDWGGVLSLTWAARNRARVAGAMTLNTAVHQPEGEPIPAALRAALAGPLLPASTVFTDAFIRVTLALADRLDPALARAYRLPYCARALRGGVGAFVADIPVDERHPSYRELKRLGEEIAGLDVPALILWGPKDPVFQERYLRDLRARMPQADVHRFETTSHLLAEDVDYAATILRWLRHRFPAGRSHAPARADGAQNAPSDGAPAPGDGARLIFDALDARAQDGSPASVDMSRTPAQSVSWAHLSFVVDRIARGLQLAGLRRGDRVSLLVTPGNDLTAAAYGVLKAGGVAVVADAGLSPAGMTRAIRAADPQWIIGEVPGLTLARAAGWPGRRVSVRPLGALPGRALRVETSLTALVRDTPDGPIATPGLDDDAAILFTSGSTGPAKGVRYTHRSLGALAGLLAGHFGVRPGTGLVAGFPPFALLGPGIGATSVTPDMSVTKPRTLTAAALADAVAAGDCTMVFASPAAFANVVATAADLTAGQRAACGRVELVLSAGAPVPLSLMDAVAQVFPAAQLHSPYGMTEGLLLTDIDRPGVAQAAESGEHGVCVGTPIPGVELTIAPLTMDGTAAASLLSGADAAGVLGEVVVAAPHVKDGYDRLWDTQAQSARDGSAAEDPDAGAGAGPGAQRHRTNDIGHLDAAGRLWLEGRLQHVITAPGGPIGPAGLEAIVDELPGVLRSAAVGVGPVGTQAIVCVLEPNPAQGLHPGLAPLELADAVRAAALAALGLDVAAVLVAREFPTDIRHNSKIDRSRLARWAAEALAGGAL